jgi:hypothetical protein
MYLYLTRQSIWHTCLEIRQALEAHRHVDQRPPFTYALLIRQVNTII